MTNRSHLWAFGAIATDLALATAVGAVERPAETSISVPVAQLEFYQSKEGLTFAKAWGDPETGPHSNYIKIPGDTAGALHVHTFDYYGVVIAGVVANEPSLSSPDRPLAAGSYWFQKGGAVHVTKCLSHAECIIFVTSSGPFDYIAQK